MSKKGTVEERMQLAERLRQIRESAGWTQGQFAEILDISESGYVKIERGINNISVDCIKTLNQKLRISADHILFGKNQDFDDTWEEILNCSEADKMVIMLRLVKYFTEKKKSTFPLAEEQSEEDKEIWQLIEKLLDNGKD